MFCAKREKAMQACAARFNLRYHEAQQDYLTDDAKVLLINSGPGSGKTTISMSKLFVEGIVNGIHPNRMYAMTFSDRAANQLKHKYAELSAKFGFTESPRMTTIHALAYEFIRIYKSELGITDDIVVVEDRRIEKKNFKEVVDVLAGENSGISEALVTLYFETMSLVDNLMLESEEDILALPNVATSTEDFDASFFKRAHKLYARSRVTTGRLDFDGMPMLFHKLLSDHPNIRTIVQNQFDLILVDELQDTSKLQASIVHLMSHELTRVIMIGDKDQSIYGWRGASSTIYDFVKELWPEAVEKEMKISFRCPQKILDFASDMVSLNYDGMAHEHTRIQGFSEEANVRLIQSANRYSLSEIFADEIAAEFKRNNEQLVSLKDTLVLYRNHMQAIFLVEMLALRNIPCIVDASLLPHKHEIMQDILNMSALLMNPTDQRLMKTTLRKFIPVPRGRSNETWFTGQLQKNSYLPFFDILPPDLKWKNKFDLSMNKLKKLSADIAINAESYSSIAKQLFSLYYSNYYDNYSKYKGVPSDEVDAIVEYIDNIKVKTYMSYRNMISRLDSFLADYTASGKGLRVFTIHKAKGLEAKTVMLFDCSAGAFPNRRVLSLLESKNNKKGIHEYILGERCAAFVAMTRAEKNLVIGYKSGAPSEFLIEAGILQGYSDLLTLQRNASHETITEDLAVADKQSAAVGIDFRRYKASAHGQAAQSQQVTQKPQQVQNRPQSVAPDIPYVVGTHKKFDLVMISGVKFRVVEVVNGKEILKRE